MNHLITYKGYHAKIEYDAEDRILVGQVIAINDTLVFEGTTPDEVEAMFHETIDDYLALCAQLGKEPDKEYKGSFNVRISSELHKSCVLKAESMGQSLNQFVAAALERAVCNPYTEEIAPAPSVEATPQYQGFIAPAHSKIRYLEDYRICQTM